MSPASAGGFSTTGPPGKSTKVPVVTDNSLGRPGGPPWNCTSAGHVAASEMTCHSKRTFKPHNADFVRESCDFFRRCLALTTESCRSGSQARCAPKPPTGSLSPPHCRLRVKGQAPQVTWRSGAGEGPGPRSRGGATREKGQPGCTHSPMGPRSLRGISLRATRKLQPIPACTPWWVRASQGPSGGLPGPGRPPNTPGVPALYLPGHPTCHKAACAG